MNSIVNLKYIEQIYQCKLEPFVISFFKMGAFTNELSSLL